MIEGFHKETQPLTADEFRILQLIVPKLRGNIGEDMAVQGKVIVDYVVKRGFKFDVIRLRKIINFIRTQDVIPFLKATSKGYYVEYRESEIDKYILSLKQREDSIANTRRCIERQKQRFRERLT